MEVVVLIYHFHDPCSYSFEKFHEELKQFQLENSTKLIRIIKNPIVDGLRIIPKSIVAIEIQKGDFTPFYRWIKVSKGIKSKFRFK